MDIICRTCLGIQNLQSIFDEDVKNMITSLTSVQINQNDELPKNICIECYHRLKESYDFKVLCEKSDKELRSQIRGFTVPNISDVKKEIQLVPESHNYSAKNKADDDPKIKDISRKREKIASTKKKRLWERESAIPMVVPTTNSDYGADHHFCSEEEPIKIIKKIQSKSTQCSVCGKVVSSEFRLNCHMRIHTGEKPYKCEYCDRCFTLSYNLKVHERTHTGEKPLRCSICNKNFAQSAGLISHMRMHTGEKPYKCTMCTMAFKTCSHLQYHIRLHTGEKKFVCDICQRGFITKGDLTQHKRTHTGERTYICTVCGLGLSRNYHLTRHMLTHSGIKNFKCTYCENAYSQKSDLKRHIRKHSTADREKVDKVIKETSDYVILKDAVISGPGFTSQGYHESGQMNLEVGIERNADHANNTILIHCNQSSV